MHLGEHQAHKTLCDLAQRAISEFIPHSIERRHDCEGLGTLAKPVKYRMEGNTIPVSKRNQHNVLHFKKSTSPCE